MNELIAALLIFAQYGNPDSPTHCEHDIMLVMIHPDDVSAEDTRRLDKLGFFVSSEWPEYFASYRYGSA